MHACLAQFLVLSHFTVLLKRVFIIIILGSLHVSQNQINLQLQAQLRRQMKVNNQKQTYLLPSQIRPSTVPLMSYSRPATHGIKILAQEDLMLSRDTCSIFDGTDCAKAAETMPCSTPVNIDILFPLLGRNMFDQATCRYYSVMHDRRAT
ncbi:hypothetical protein EI94DRAFT_1724581 [Lactarius quietus]|nr:hypothetical protein EI94DRAFT_1724581 [Lactarius quietus]